MLAGKSFSIGTTTVPIARSASFSLRAQTCLQNKLEFESLAEYLENKRDGSELILQLFGRTCKVELTKRLG